MPPRPRRSRTPLSRSSPLPSSHDISIELTMVKKHDSTIVDITARSIMRVANELNDIDTPLSDNEVFLPFGQLFLDMICLLPI